MTLKYQITLIMLLISACILSQEAELIATVSKNKLGVNQRLKVEFSINKQGSDNFTPPNFRNFKVISGPSQSVSQSWINGKVSFSQSYSYIIQPKQKGEFDLPSASVEINGKTIQSKPVKIIVTAAVETPKNPNDPNYVAEQNIHLVAEVSKSKPYVGEGIYVEYRLYFSNNIQIYDYGITESPQYSGFWNQEIKLKGTPVKTAMYNGEKYRYAVLHKALLIPTKSGKLSIDPMKMDIIVAVPTGRADFFGNVITRQVRKEFASTKKRILPKDLPIEGKPESFTGAVGKFDYNVALSRNNLKANESSQIKVTINGKGNLKLFEIPKIETPKELEVYQPERKERVKITSTGLTGSITENYTVVPEFKGKYKIPKTEFSYFNPKDQKYHTINSEDLFVDVLEGKELAPASSGSNQITQKKKVTTTGKDFRYIQTSTKLKEYTSSNFFKSSLFYCLLLLPLISIPIGIFILKKKEEKDADITGNKLRKANRLAKKYLADAEKELGKKESFYEALQRAFHNFLKAKLNIETSDISRSKISELLKDRHIDDDTISSLITLLNNCDFARYTPTSDVEMKEELEKAKQVITQIDKQLK